MHKLCPFHPSMAVLRILSRAHQSNSRILPGNRNFCSKPDGLGYPEHIFESSNEYHKFLSEASTWDKDLTKNYHYKILNLPEDHPSQTSGVAEAKPETYTSVESAEIQKRFREFAHHLHPDKVAASQQS